MTLELLFLKRASTNQILDKTNGLDKFLHLTDFMILGGLELCVSRYLSHIQSGLRWRAAQLIASCAQNMPQVQEHLLQIEVLPKLLKLTDSDPNPTVRVKALYAVSCKLIITKDAESELS